MIVSLALSLLMVLLMALHFVDSIRFFDSSICTNRIRTLILQGPSYPAGDILLVSASIEKMSCVRYLLHAVLLLVATVL